MILEITALVVLFAVSIFLLMDLVPLSLDWVGRIHIGRYANKTLWKERTAAKAVAWLNRTPKIKVTDNTRLVLLDIMKGQYSSGAIQSWQEAALLLGVGEYAKDGTMPKARKEVDVFLKRKFDGNGQWVNPPRHVDEAILAYAVMKLDFIDIDQYKPAFDAVWNLIQEHIGEDGTVAYRKHMQNYRYVDTIGFICPFLTVYGIKYNKPECVALAVKQIKEYEQYGMMKKEFIPFHAYEINTKHLLGLCGWGRGTGWYAIGLADTWNELPEEHEAKAVLQKSVQQFAQMAIRCQQENGSWNWTVTRKEARADSSTAATLSWFLLQASAISELSDECLTRAEKALSYLTGVTRRNGAIDFSQGDTKDIGVYAMLFQLLPFTQGFSIRSMHIWEQKRNEARGKEAIRESSVAGVIPADNQIAES